MIRILLPLLLNLSNLPGLAVYHLSFKGFTTVEKSLMQNHLIRTIGSVKRGKFYVTDFDWIDSRTQEGDILVASTNGTGIDTRQEYIYVLVDGEWTEVPAWYIQIPRNVLDAIRSNADVALKNIIVHEMFHVIDNEAPHSERNSSVFSAGLNISKVEWTNRDRDWVRRRLGND